MVDDWLLHVQVVEGRCMFPRLTMKVDCSLCVAKQQSLRKSVAVRKSKGMLGRYRFLADGVLWGFRLLGFLGRRF